MYRIEDEVSAIREVQRMLLIISQVENGLPNISVDGIYTDETKSAVLIYQTLRGLERTSYVNNETFDALFKESEIILNDRNNSLMVIRQETYPLRLGDSGENVSRLNINLLSLSRFYPDIPIPDTRGFFGKNTEDALRYFQRILRVEDNGIATEWLVLRLEKEIMEREKFT